MALLKYKQRESKPNARNIIETFTVN